MRQHALCCLLLVCALVSISITDAFAPPKAGSAAARQGAVDTAPLLEPSSLQGVSRSVQATDRTTELSFNAARGVVKAWAAEAFGLLSPDQLALLSDDKEATQRHVRFQQVEVYEGGKARVLGGDAIVHIDAANTVYATTGTIVPGTESVPLPPTVSRDSAIATIVQHVQTVREQPGFTAEKMKAPELYIVPSASGLKLVWCSEFLLLTGPTPSQPRVCTDAQGDGGVLESINVLRTAAATGKAKTLHSGLVDVTTDKVGNKYYLWDPVRNAYTIDVKGGMDDEDTNTWAPGTWGNTSLVTDPNNVWGNYLESNRKTIAGDAHYGMALTYDYYLKVHGRKGVDGKGGRVFSRVHYGGGQGDAFWSDDCNCMSYDDGNADTLPTASIDVAGHEITHGVTSKSAGLVYEAESGALNEAFSDIFGTVIEWYAKNPKDEPDYLCGEKLVRPGGGGPVPVAVRYMYRPSLDGKSKDCWYKDLKKLDVHYSSGVGNHWFYLLAEGSNPTNGQPKSPTCNRKAVLGIGRNKAAKIAYRALTVYMTERSDYKDARVCTLLAAKDLYGKDSVQFKRVDQAWAAVKVVGPAI